MARRGRHRSGNPLALAVLATLAESPTHPYQVSALLRSRGKDDSIKINYGSLYTVIAGLEKRGLIQAVGAQREGRRPERTVFELTSEGRREMTEWLEELVSEPLKEFPRFESALSLLGMLRPERASHLLRDRLVSLRMLQQTDRRILDETPIPRVLLIEVEYRMALREAEIDYVTRLVDAIDDGTIDGLDDWREVHDHGVLRTTHDHAAPT